MYVPAVGIESQIVDVLQRISAQIQRLQVPQFAKQLRRQTPNVVIGQIERLKLVEAGERVLLQMHHVRGPILVEGPQREPLQAGQPGEGQAGNAPDFALIQPKTVELCQIAEVVGSQDALVIEDVAAFDGDASGLVQAAQVLGQRP